MQYLDQFHILDLHILDFIVTYTYIMFHEILFKGYLVWLILWALIQGL